MLQTETRDALEAERAALALAVEDGDEDALPRLMAVEQQLAADASTRERVVLAATERERREAEAQAAAEEAARKKYLQELRRLAKDRLKLAGEIDSVVSALVEHVERLLSTGDGMSAAAMRLGAPPRAHDPRRYAPDWIAHQLSEVEPRAGGFGFTFPRAHEGLRGKTFTEIERERLAGLVEGEVQNGR